MSAASAITVLARWQMPEATVAEVLKLAATVRQQSLAEPGCLGYEVFRSIDEPGSLLLVERYRDEAAIEAHRQSLHYRELVAARIVPLLTSRQVELLRA
ncbi:putative quinol monooxygenase [Paucibacter sp. R3-3]|uniref:Quinol monooxygenase n=1 Tax=Roseateles agri TaxID=3098619 RepID=A0ABU5DCZ6_9BURK|nr:putative quinol monooxygenase [Paucibacter sp. R3-3]MDY0744143.1 putative quinol monooxygenase [Paucibacter sp. R3-3]